MSLGYLLQAEYLRWNLQRPIHDLLRDLVDWGFDERIRAPGVAGQPHRRRNHPEWDEILHPPFPASDARHADDAVRARAQACVLEDRRAYQVKHLAEPAGTPSYVRRTYYTLILSPSLSIWLLRVRVYSLWVKRFGVED